MYSHESTCCVDVVGAELTFNYNLVSVGEKKLECLCNAPSCSGYIGERTVKVWCNMACHSIVRTVEY